MVYLIDNVNYLTLENTMLSNGRNYPDTTSIYKIDVINIKAGSLGDMLLMIVRYMKVNTK